MCTSSMRISIYATVGRIDCNEWRAAYNNNNDHPTSHPKGVTAEALHHFRWLVKPNCEVKARADSLYFSLDIAL